MPLLNRPGSGVVVVIVDFVKQHRIPAAPRVDGLLYVAHTEKTPSAGRILYGFIDQIPEHAPLAKARVLKFVEQPVVNLGIQPEQIRLLPA